jgi:hypothetical protein
MLGDAIAAAPALAAGGINYIIIFLVNYIA